MRQFVRQNLFLFGLIISLAACHSVANSDDLLLDRANSLMQHYPDSALSLLETLSFPQNPPSPQSARYALLLTQAHDKNYVTHTDDSLIRIAVHYYDSVDGDVGLRAKAHYYWGRVQQDRKEIPSCVHEYLMAISLAEKAEEKNISYLAYANLGFVFYMADFNDRADSCFRQAELLAVQFNDSARLAWVLAQTGGNYMAKEEAPYPIAKQYLDRALMIAKITGNRDVEEITSSSLSTYYSLCQDGRSAVEFAKGCIALSGNDSTYYGVYLLVGDGYYQLAQYDSAKIYLQKSLPVNSSKPLSGVYMRLSDIAKAEGHYEEAVKYENLLTDCLDSMRVHQQSVAIASVIKDASIYSIREHQAISFSRFQYLLIFLLAILVLLVVFFIYKRRKYYQDALKVHVERENLKTHLTHELEQKSLALDQLRQFLQLRPEEAESAEAQQMRAQIHALEEEKRLILKSLLEHLEVYLKMQQIIRYYKEYGDYKECFEQDDWVHLMMSIDASQQFRQCLLACNNSLQEDEIHLCYLLQIGLSVIDISIVLGCTRDNVYKKKKAVFAKLKLAAENDELKDIWERVASIF